MRRRSPNNKLVIISSYVEKPARRRKRLQQIANHTKKSDEPNPFSGKLLTTTKTGTHGISRRARLLAYTRELRSSGTEQPKLKERNKSSPERKKMVSFFELFRRKEKQEVRYERIPTLETEELCGLKRAKRRNSHRDQSKISSFCGRLQRMLRKLSCRLQCDQHYRI